LVLSDIDHPTGVVPEEPEVPVYVEIHRGWLDTALPQRGDGYATGVERLTD
jgi:hypothetical protein